jgi:hypothetical protein
MKIVGLYQHTSILYLERNHRKFAENNQFTFKKYFARNYYEKYRLIYFELINSLGELFCFIDSNSYFIHDHFNFILDTDILVNSEPGAHFGEGEEFAPALDNFIIIRSTLESIRAIEKVTSSASFCYWGERKIDFKASFPTKYVKSHHFKHEDIYLNIDAPSHPEFFNFKNILVCHLNPNRSADFFSYANLLCGPSLGLPHTSESDFEVFNPGCKNALLTLHTPEIGLQGAVCERNLKRYCFSKEMTLYVHRKNPRAQERIAATWLKPELLLRHLPDHQFLAWVDSDILLSLEYRLDLSNDFTAYQDIGDWKFNAGLLIFKNCEKIRLFLESVQARCESISDRSSTHVNQSDQGQFIAEAKEHFPEFLPSSNLRINMLPGYEADGALPLAVHFVGIPTHVRARIMNSYDSLFFS